MLRCQLMRSLCNPRRLSVLLTASAAVALALLLTSASSPATTGTSAGAGDQRVICVTSYGNHATGAYRYKPHKCVLHQRGAFPVAGANTASLGRIHWKHWAGQAKGTGKIGISTAGSFKAKIRLTKPHRPCGVVVYTKASISYHGTAYNGEPVKGHFKMPIDNCLR